MPRLAITLGDPRGIGAEVVAKALESGDPLEADLVLVGPEGLEHTGRFELISVGPWEVEGGEVLAGELAAAAIEEAVHLAVTGEADAVVTAPISKPALAAAGYTWPGHTEMLRDLTGARETALCMVCEETGHGHPLRVVLVTGHLPLAEVPRAYTIERLCHAGRLAHDGLQRWWGLEHPRIAICGLNPHASDRGLFGDEERRICEPAIERLRESGIDAQGPYPADTVFTRMLEGEADVVLAPYHDVGLTAIKTACFGKAVNVTLGLPFPRTSPDHGTAFDIAGTGRADAGSMRTAIELAVRFARRSLTALPDDPTFPKS